MFVVRLKHQQAFVVLFMTQVNSNTACFIMNAYPMFQALSWEHFRLQSPENDKCNLLKSFDVKTVNCFVLLHLSDVG